MKKGISLITISVLVLVLLILVSVIGVSVTRSYNEAKKLEVLTELNMLQTAVENYKATYGTLPITNEVYELSELPESIRNEQFQEETEDDEYSFYAINYDLINIQSLKYGNGTTKDDKYVVSSLTGKVYYVKGVKVGENIYYSADKEVIGILSGNGKNDINSEEPIVYDEEFKNGNLEVTIRVPKVYTLSENSVKFEQQILSLDTLKTDSNYNVYTCYPNTIGTIRVNYLNAQNRERLSKHIVYDTRLLENTETKGLVRLLFDENGGNCDIDKLEQISGNPIKLPVAYKLGHTFVGWYTAATGGTKKEYSIMPATSEVLYAHYTVNNYVVTYNANSGSVNPSSIVVTFGEEYGALATPTRNGYVFLGWFTDVEVGTKVESTTRLTVPNDTTIYAHWQQEVKNTLTLNANEGYFGNNYNSTTRTITAVVGSSITIPEPKRSEYKFIGWYTAATGGTKVEYTTMPATSQTIYAHWEALPIIWFTNGPTVNGSGGGNVSSFSCRSSQATIPAGSTIYYTATYNFWYYPDNGINSSAMAAIALGSNTYSNTYIYNRQRVNSGTFGYSNSSVDETGEYYFGNSQTITLNTYDDVVAVQDYMTTSIHVVLKIDRVVSSDGTEYVLKKSHTKNCNE